MRPFLLLTRLPQGPPVAWADPPQGGGVAAHDGTVPGDRSSIAEIRSVHQLDPDSVGIANDADAAYADPGRPGGPWLGSNTLLCERFEGSVHAIHTKREVPEEAAVAGRRSMQELEN